MEAPSHLSPPSAAWFTQVTDEFDLEDHHLKLLTLACEAWDRGVQAREVLAVKGLTFDDRFGAPHARPEIAIERDCRIAFARLVRELALDVSEPEESRPPEIRGNSKLRSED